MQRTADRSTPAILAAYYASLLIFLAASYFPEARVWGVNWWAYYPLYVRYAVFGLGVIAPLIIHFSLRADAVNGKDMTPRAYIIANIAVIVALASLFYILRAKTYFLGDGYQLLARGTESAPHTKMTEVGEELLHGWLRSLIGGSPRVAAVLSYQIISIAAGLSFLLASVLFAARFFERRWSRLLWILCTVTGGYMLLYFGYVENYSLFSLSIALFALTGLLIAKSKAGRWWILLPLAGAIFFHILGVTLIPAALYLLISGTPLRARLSRLRADRRNLIIAATLVATFAVIIYFYSTDYFFHFSIVPPIADRFTVDGYTAFSWGHLADFANLILVLVPGVLVFAAVAYHAPMRALSKRNDFRFLLLLSLSTLGAMFIFDPKLGMPRDWDLFSFGGLPLMCLAAYVATAGGTDGVTTHRSVLLAVCLALLLLLPRAYSLKEPSLALEHVQNYLLLDMHKNRAGSYIFQQYFTDQGDSTIAAQIAAARAKAYPEERFTKMASGLLQSGRNAKAAELYRQAIGINPSYGDAWLGLGLCMLSSNQLDSAIYFMRVADGLNPGSAYGYMGFGHYFLRIGDLKRARYYWIKAEESDPNNDLPPRLLAMSYLSQRDTAQYIMYMSDAVERKDAGPSAFAELADFWTSRDDYRKAADLYRRALERGLDSAHVDSIMREHPGLRSAWTEPQRGGSDVLK